MLKKIITICRDKYVVTSLILIILFYLLIYLSSWWPLRVQNVGGGHSYEDLKFVLQNVDCHYANNDANFKDCPPGSYQYGTVLLTIFNLMHITQTSVAVLGPLLIFSLIIIFGYLIIIAQPKNLLISIYITSPVLWLLFERGNIDSLIFILLFFATLTLLKEYEFLGILLVALSALIKFYTLPILLIIPFIVKNKATKIISALSFLVLIPVVVTSIKAIETFPFPMFSAFGSPAYGLWLNFFSWKFSLGFKLSDLESHVIGLLIYVITTLSLLLSKKLQKRISLKTIDVPNNRIFRLYVIFTGSYLIVYLAGMNFDYRMIYLMTSLILLSKVNTELFNNVIFQIFALTSLWMTYFFFGFTGAVPIILMIAGNISQGVISSILTCEVVFRLKMYKKFIHTV